MLFQYIFFNNITFEIKYVCWYRAYGLYILINIIIYLGKSSKQETLLNICISMAPETATMFPHKSTTSDGTRHCKTTTINLQRTKGSITRSLNLSHSQRAHLPTGMSQLHHHQRRPLPPWRPNMTLIHNADETNYATRQVGSTATPCHIFEYIYDGNTVTATQLKCDCYHNSKCQFLISLNELD